ncbi:MAG: hypothetical protein ACFFDS_05680 [Candidatus Thorarchaeota archaeon]
MSKKVKKGPGRPRIYDSDAERKKAYRERKKEEMQKLESRVKRITELKGRINDMEKKLVKSTYTDKEIPEEISKIHEQIKDRSRRYTPSELMDLEIEDLKRIRSSIQSRYYGSYYNPLLAALESAVMPSVDREFDSRKKITEDIPYEIVVRDKLAKPDDDATPKIELKPKEYLELAKKKGLKVSEDDLFVKRSTIEKKTKDDTRHWKNLKDPYRTDQLLDVFQELILLYSVEAELARRERATALDQDVAKLEKKLAELEKTLKDEKLREVKRSAERRKVKK